MAQDLPNEVLHVLEKYEKEFFKVVDAKYNLHRLKRKMVIDDGLMVKIESTNNETAKELLFEHLRFYANMVTLREYCKMIIAAEAFPKMRKLGIDMLRELAPEEASESGDSSHIGTEHPLQEQRGRNPSAVQSLIEQFQRAEMDGKPAVHPKPAQTYRSAPVVCQLPEPCVQDDEQLQMMVKNLDKLNKEDLFHLLSQKVDTDTAQKFWEHRVSGANLVHITSDELKDIGVLVGPKKNVESIITDFKRTAQTEPADEDPDVKYCVNFWNQNVTDQQKMIPPPAKPMKNKSRLIERGPPEVYQLPLVLSRSEKGVIQYSIGKQPQLRVPVSVVMVVGATGAGMSTWINGMANYVLGVKWRDYFRFKLVNDGTGSQAHSKTKEIIAYTIYRQEGSPFPNTLTMIDTPGFGNMEGIKRDQILVEQVREFFSMGGVNGIDCLHAIGFVTQASMVRLTPTQKYIFDSILSIFGNDIKHNILLMTTFADNRKPAVLDAVKAADIPYTKYYNFNNSALFTEPPDAQSGNDAGGPTDELYWKLCMDSYDKFAKTLVTMRAQSLTLTREVLEERQQLETVMQSLQVQMKLWVRKIAVLKQEERCMEENEAKIAANENFTYTVKTPKVVKYDLSGVGIHVTNCLNCNYTCHDNCIYANNDEKIKCSAMKDGSCTVCPKRCRWNRHVSNPWRFEVFEETEERTYDELKQRYDEATQAKSRVQVMVANIQAKIRSTYDEIMGLVVRAQQTLQRLDEIALKPSPLSQVEYIDLLIQCEKDGKDGYLERIQYLNAVRGRAELLSMVQKKGGNVHQDLEEAARIASGTTTHS